MSRDNARTPMQWDTSLHAGFTTGAPWIPVNPNYREVNVAAELADPDSVLHHYRRLIELRHTEPVVALGDFTMLLPDDEQVYAFTRRLGDVELLVLGNFSGDPAVVDLPYADVWAAAELLLGNYPAEATPAAASFGLRQWETRVYRCSIR
jgi:oligo-1,6-glucosidase